MTHVNRVAERPKGARLHTSRVQHRPGFLEPLRRLLLSMVLFAMLSAALVTGATTTAAAFDGRNPDARAVTARGEIDALYWHGLNRDPDPTGMASYTALVNRDCSWGVQLASFSILTSPEAHAVWRENPQTFAGMLYAALLNRPPDPGGLATYTSAIVQRGLPWATTAMMSSNEYHQRLARICPIATDTVAMLGATDATEWSQFLLGRAENLAGACGLNKATRAAIASLRTSAAPPAKLVGGLATVANAVSDRYKLDGTCGAALSVLRATLAINQTIAGPQNNPVFLWVHVGKPGILNGRQKNFIIRVGTNPTGWSEYSGKAW